MGYWLLGFLVGLATGWICAHNIVAHECETLGRFYVGKQVFECTAVKAQGEGRTG